MWKHFFNFWICRFAVLKDSKLKQFIKNSYKKRQRGIYYSESDPGWREAVWHRGPSLNCLGPSLQSGLTMKPQCFISKRLWKCDPISLQQTSEVSDGAPLCGCCSTTPETINWLQILWCNLLDRALYKSVRVTDTRPHPHYLTIIWHL